MHRITWFPVEDLHSSDHFPLVFKITPNQTAPPHPPPPPSPNLKLTDWDLFNSTLKLPPIFPNDPSLTTSLLEQALHSAISQSTPPPSLPSKPTAPWWSPLLTITCRNRKRALRSFRKRPTLENFINHKRATALSRKALRDHKRESWRLFVSSINRSTPLSELWSKVKSVMSKRQLRYVSGLMHDGNIIVSTLEIAEVIARHFAQVAAPPAQIQAFPTLHYPIDTIVSEYAFQKDLNRPFTITELSHALHKLRPSAAGPDKIRIEVLQHLNSTNKQYILNYFNSLFLSRQFPNQWRTSITIPIPKPNTDSLQPSNYRPISLSSHLGKLLERIVNYRLRFYLEYNSLLHPNQYGFRQHRSTIEPLLGLVSTIKEALSSRQFVIALFLDISKAFDTIDRNSIIMQLQQWGVHGNMLQYIQNFLSGRTF